MTMLKHAVLAAVVMAFPSLAFGQLPGEPKAPPAYDITGDAIYRFKRGTPDETVREAQRVLKDKGYYRGPLDGLMTPEMRRAVWNFQKSEDLRLSGSLDPATMAALERGSSGSARSGETSNNGSQPSALPRSFGPEPPASTSAPVQGDFQAP